MEATTTIRKPERKRERQSLEELDAIAAELKQAETMTAEEKQKQMGVIYSRRKRVKQKLRCQTLEERQHMLMKENQRLRLENDNLTAILHGAMARIQSVGLQKRGLPSITGLYDGRGTAAAQQALMTGAASAYHMPPFRVPGGNPSIMPLNMAAYGLPGSAYLPGHLPPIANAMNPSLLGGSASNAGEGNGMPAASDAMMLHRYMMSRQHGY